MTLTSEPSTAAGDGAAPIRRREAMDLAETAYARFADVVDGLSPDDWGRPTDCDGWTVRDLVGHVVGAMRSAASVRVLAAEQREVKRRAKALGGQEVDHMTALQVEAAADLDTEELRRELRALVPRAAAGRRRLPLPMRKLVRVRVEMGQISERWTVGYLVDTILTRDAWLHRVDLCRAVGADLVLTAEHDGRIVGDVATEWGRRHGRPHRLVLTGPAGGTFGTAAGPGVTGLELDAVEFCRIVSGRAPGEGLLAHQVPF
jgi:uncharacterized protein (TIGR03083 family)